MGKKKCSECGCNMLPLTELYTAICEFQHLVVDKSICLNCECDPATAITIGYILTTPAKHGDSCPQKHANCFLGELDKPAAYDDEGPDDLKDDWPHAKSESEGVRLLM